MYEHIEFVIVYFIFMIPIASSRLHLKDKTTLLVLIKKYFLNDSHPLLQQLWCSCTLLCYRWGPSALRKGHQIADNAKANPPL